jgi:hypothetical protein
VEQDASQLFCHVEDVKLLMSHFHVKIFLDKLILILHNDQLVVHFPNLIKIRRKKIFNFCFSQPSGQFSKTCLATSDAVVVGRNGNSAVLPLTRINLRFIFEEKKIKKIKIKFSFSYCIGR